MIRNTDQLLKYLPQSENTTIGKYTDGAIYTLSPIQKYSDVLSELIGAFLGTKNKSKISRDMQF